MASGGKKCRVIVSDEATQMLISHARFLLNSQGVLERGVGDE